MPKERRIFTPEFKQQMVDLYENEKSRMAVIKEYELSASALDRWIKQSQTTGSFKEKDNRSPEENELNRRNRNVDTSKEVQMWLDIAIEIDEAARIWLRFVLNKPAS